MLFKTAISFLFIYSIAASTIPRKRIQIEGSLPYNNNIINALEDIKDLVSQVTIDEVVAKHMLIDGNFRDAFFYLISDSFQDLVKKVEQVPEVLEILAFVHLIPQERVPHFVEHDLNIVTLEDSEDELSSLEAYLTVLLMEAIQNYKEEKTRLQSFPSFVDELLDHLPRSQYVAKIQEKREKIPDFEKFYIAIKSSEFKDMVDAALESKNLSGILKTLNDKGVSVRNLEPLLFKLISWGPKV